MEHIVAKKMNETRHRWETANQDHIRHPNAVHPINGRSQPVGLKTIVTEAKNLEKWAKENRQ